MRSLGRVKKKPRTVMIIIADILKVCRNGPATGTQIYIEARLGGTIACYVQRALDLGLLQKTGCKYGGRLIVFYRPTEKGHEFLKCMDIIEGLLHAEEQAVKEVEETYT